MRLENNEYIVSKAGVPDESITITKAALEKWRDRYLEVAERYRLDITEQDDMNVWKWGLYTGMADSLTDLLKHFEEEKV